VYVGRRFGVHASRVLGAGKEGVVVTDGETVFKVCDRWEAPPGTDPASIVASLSESGPWQTLYPVRLLWKEDGCPLFTYPFEPSEPYAGGHEEEFVTFLLEATRAGFVMSNVRPENFIVTARGLRLVDYGVSFSRWTEDGFLHMARRAWLTFRCHGRGDLRSLMRTALRDPSLPELRGFDSFFSRVHRADPGARPIRLATTPLDAAPLAQEAILDPRIVSIAMAREPTTALDFGCGKGKVSEALAARGVRVTGWDPDPNRITRCRSNGGSVEYLDSIAPLLRDGETFDVVVCSLVACVLEAGVPELFREIRRLVSPTGRVVFAICNPFYDLEGSSEIHRDRIANQGEYHSHAEVLTFPRSSSREVRGQHRPWHWYERYIVESGLRVAGLEESEGISPLTGCPNPDYLIAVLEPEPFPVRSVSLVIRACALEADTIEAQVRHIVRQLGRHSALQQRIVALDGRSVSFPRSHGSPDIERVQSTLRRLIQEGVIDEIVDGAGASTELNERWFGIRAPAPRASNGQAVVPMLAAFEHCSNHHVVAVDADVMLFGASGHDPVGDAVSVLDRDPRGLTASLNIAHGENRPWTRGSEAGPWRVEARAAVFARDRVLAARPFPNSLDTGQLAMPWHRSFDAKLGSVGLGSWRGGDRRSGFVHPPNDLKWPREPWLEVLDRIESGFLPACQYERVDLVGVGEDWRGPKRPERYVFVICGRNVTPGRIRRCLDSLRAQSGSWGAIVIDDASDNGASEYLDIAADGLEERVTLIRSRARRGLLFNLHRSVHDYVIDSESIILTLDLDDALVGTDALHRVVVEYEKGADLTVGSMRRTDKDVRYEVDFSDPRRKRGGNVWQHLRTFKKRLFDRIRKEDLQLDGEWIDLANDWAYMVPLVEMAQSPRHIRDILYLYDPSEDKLNRRTQIAERESTIARIIAKPRYLCGGERT
jgi:SAM-dependent methyltransferase